LKKEGGVGGREEAQEAGEKPGARCGAWAAPPCWSRCFAVREEEDRRGRVGEEGAGAVQAKVADAPKSGVARVQHLLPLPRAELCHAEPCSASSTPRPLRCRAPSPLLCRRVQERKVSLNPLDFVVDPAFAPRLNRAL
jgi:hypothetical protein